jgi:hypothetical protein
VDDSFYVQAPELLTGRRGQLSGQFPAGLSKSLGYRIRIFAWREEAVESIIAKHAMGWRSMADSPSITAV